MSHAEPDLEGTTRQGRPEILGLGQGAAFARPADIRQHWNRTNTRERIDVMPLTLWGNPILEWACAPVDETEFGSGLATLVDRMFKVMYAAHGVGLAAPQVGISKRLFVYDCDGTRGVVANPVFLERSSTLSEDVEGCLSVPGFFWPTPRASAVVLRGQNAFGDNVEISASGYLARCMQHETDHVDGQLYLARLGGRVGKLARRNAKQANWYGTPHRFIDID